MAGWLPFAYTAATIDTGPAPDLRESPFGVIIESRHRGDVGFLVTFSISTFARLPPSKSADGAGAANVASSPETSKGKVKPMKKTLTATILAFSLTASSVLAQGNEANMSEQQVAQAMISSSGSLVANPSSGPASSAPASVSGVPLVLGLLVVLVIAASRSGHHYLVH